MEDRKPDLLRPARPDRLPLLFAGLPITCLRELPIIHTAELGFRRSVCRNRGAVGTELLGHRPVGPIRPEVGLNL
jgi:hypothetical protein